MNILCIGGATTDMFLIHKDVSRLQLDAEHKNRSFLIFEEGQKVAIDNLIFHTGGGATNSAVSFQRLGFETAIFCKVGTDQAADFIKQRLIKEGIDITHLVQSKEHMTGQSCIIPCPNGDRVVLVYRGANAHLNQDELPLKSFAQYDNVYITSLSDQSSHLLPIIVKQAKKHNSLVATNPGTSQLSLGSKAIYEALPYVDIFILNREESCTFMLSMIQQDSNLHSKMLNKQIELLQKKKSSAQPHVNQATLLANPFFYQSIYFDIRIFFQEILSHGPKIVVLTNGAEGVYVGTKDGIIFHPSLPGHIENTLGAGDAFGSCFVAQYIKGKTVQEAMLYGILNASSVISLLGAKTGLLNSSELEQKYKSAPKHLFQHFELN